MLAQDTDEGLVVHLLDALQLAHLLYLALREPALATLHEAVESHLGGVGDEGEHGVVDIVIDRLEDGIRELLSELLALVVDIAVASAGEVDALEGAGGVATLRHDLVHGALAGLIDDDGLAGLQLLDVLTLEVEGGLQHRALRGDDDDLVVLVVEARTDAPGVAHGEEVAAAGDATDDIASVEVGHGRLEHIGHLDMVLDVARDVLVLQSVVAGNDKVALHLAVEAMAHQLQQDIGVAIDARTLAHGE